MRTLSFLLLVSFGLFAYASPVINKGGISVRSLVPRAPKDLVEHLERRGGYPDKPCNCPDDLHDVLVSFKETVSVDIQKLDGKNDCNSITTAIVEKFQASITLIGKISIPSSSVTDVSNFLSSIEILVQIIQSIGTGLLKYSSDQINTSIQKITDIHIQFIESCVSVYPNSNIADTIKASIQVKVSTIHVLPQLSQYFGFDCEA